MHFKKIAEFVWLSNDWEVNFDVEGRYCIWQGETLSQQLKINNLWESDCRETVDPEFGFSVFALNLF